MARYNYSATPVHEVVDAYIAYRQGAGRAAKKTVDNDKSVTQFLQRYMLAHVGKSLQIRYLDARVIDGFLSSRLEDGIGDGYYNVHINALKSFFHFAVRHGYVDATNNPMDRVRNVAVLPRPKILVPAARFPEMLTIAEKHHPQVRFLIALGLYTLARKNEMLSLRVSHVQRELHEINLQITKTSEVDNLPISEELGHELDRWMFFYGRDLGYRPNPQAFLLPAKQRALGGRDATGRFIYVPGNHHLDPTKAITQPEKLLQKVLLEMGFELRDEDGKSLNNGMHTLRRSAARARFDFLVESGYDGALRQVQALLHHEKAEMTERYIGLDLDKQKRNDSIKGKKMFPQVSEQSNNVVSLIERQA